MRILSIDTSARAASVAIADGARLAAGLWLEHGKTHSQALMPCIETLLSLADVKISDIDVFAAVTGPGSFTGLRIGVTTTKAMAYANNANLAGVTSFECLAYNLLAFENWLLCPVIDAGNNQVYCQMFRTDGAALEKVCDGAAADVGELARGLRREASGRGVVLNGDAAKKYAGYFRSELEGVDVICAPERDLHSDAASAALLVGGETERGIVSRLETPFSLTPDYMRESQAERLRKEKEQINR